MSVLQELSLNVEKGKRKVVPGLVQQALDEGIDPNVILNEGMIDAMGRVGEAFRDGKIFVPEMLIAAKAMQAGVATLKPALSAGGAVSRGKIILGTVAGDLHDIGKNLVGMMLESAGFEVIDLGVAYYFSTDFQTMQFRETGYPVSLNCHKKEESIK